MIKGDDSDHPHEKEDGLTIATKLHQLVYVTGKQCYAEGSRGKDDRAMIG